MFHQNPRYHNEKMGPQMRRGFQHNSQGRFPPVHPNVLHEEIQRLRAFLEMERAQRFEDNQRLAHMEEELEETKLQLKRQKAIKEVFINKSKESKRELERVEKLSDPAVVSAAILASKVHNDMRYKNKKMLQQDFVDLKTAHLLSQEAFSSEIQAEKEKGKALQEELDKLQTSYEELCSKYEADIALVRQEAEIQTFCEERNIEVQQFLENLRAEKEDMFQKMSKEIKFLKSSEKSLQDELDQVKRSYEELDGKYDRDVSGLKAQVETYKKEIDCEREASSERAKKDLEEINKLKAEQDHLYETMTEEFQTLQQKFNGLAKHLKSNIGQYEASHSSLQQQVENLQMQITEEKKVHLEDLALLHNIKAMNAVLQENAAKDMKFLQEKERDTHTELEKIKGLYKELNCRYKTDVAALTQQAEKYQQVSCERNIKLEREDEDLQLANSLEDEKEDLQQKTSQEFTDFQEKEKDSESQPDQVEVLHQEVSSEEDFSEETSSGCSTDLESTAKTEFAVETIQENVDNPDPKSMQDGKRKKPKLSVWKKLRNILCLKKQKKEGKE